MNSSSKILAALFIPLIASLIYCISFFLLIGLNGNFMGLVQFSITAIYPFGVLMLIIGSLSDKFIFPNFRSRFLIFVVPIVLAEAFWMLIRNYDNMTNIIFGVCFSAITAMLMYPFYRCVYDYKKHA